MLGEWWRVHTIISLLELPYFRLLGKDLSDYRNRNGDRLLGLDRLRLWLCRLTIHGLVSLLELVDVLEYLHAMEPCAYFHVVGQVVLGDVLYHFAVKAEIGENLFVLG